MFALGATKVHKQMRKQTLFGENGGKRVNIISLHNLASISVYLLGCMNWDFLSRKCMLIQSAASI